MRAMRGRAEGLWEPNVRRKTSVESWRVTWQRGGVLSAEKKKHSKAQGHRCPVWGRRAQELGVRFESLGGRGGGARRLVPTAGLGLPHSGRLWRVVRAAQLIRVCGEGMAAWLMAGKAAGWDAKWETMWFRWVMSRVMSEKMKGRGRVRRWVRGERTQCPVGMKGESRVTIPLRPPSTETGQLEKGSLRAEDGLWRWHGWEWRSPPAQQWAQNSSWGLWAASPIILFTCLAWFLLSSSWSNL